MLGLVVATDSAWADHAFQDLDAVLADHAHCELKAAANALSLVARHPDDFVLARKLSALAREEMDHFERVLGFLEVRGVTLGPPEPDDYAVLLRKAAKALPHTFLSPLVDRLLVGALIEARSCERFKLLLTRMNAGTEMHAFYTELFEAEARHFTEYVELAERAAGGDRAAVDQRLKILAQKEGEIVRGRVQSENRSTIHG